MNPSQPATLKRRAAVGLAIALVSAATVLWLRARPSFDGGGAVIPGDVELVALASADPLEPGVLDVSVGRSVVRIHGRESLASFEGDAFREAFARAHLASVALDAAKDAPWTLEVAVDRDVRYATLFPLFDSARADGVGDFFFVVRTPSGLGAVPAPMGVLSTRSRPPPSHEICLKDDGAHVRAHAGNADACVVAWTADGLDEAAYRTCYAHVAGDRLPYEPNPMRNTEVELAAARDVPFRRVLPLHVQLQRLGLEPVWLAPCDR